MPKSSSPIRKLGTISFTCEERGTRRDSTWQSHAQDHSLRVPFRCPQTWLLLPDATNSPENGRRNFSGHFKPGRLMCRSRSSHGICRSLRVNCTARCAGHPAGSGGPRSDDLLGSPWWVRAATAGSRRTRPATPSPEALSRGTDNPLCFHRDFAV